MINLLTVFLLVLVLEFIVFLGLEYPSFVPSPLLPAFRLYYQSGDRNIIQLTDCACYDSGLYYILRKGDCQFANREFDVQNHINMVGVRDDSLSLFNPSIVVLGDSYAMGWGVAQQESFPQVLENISQVRVLNAGISSYGTAREVQLFNRLAPGSVHTIFLQYHANDFDENQTYIRNGYKLPIRSRDSYDSLRRRINERDDYYPLKHVVGISKAVSRKMFGSGKPPVSDAESASAFMSVLAQLNIDKSKVRVIVFKMDDSNRINNGFVDAVDSLAATEPFRDWKISTLRVTDLTQQDYFVLDDHINAQGHRKIAAKMAQTLNPAFN